MLWNSETGIVAGESGMFLGKEKVKLLFPAEKILNVYHPVLKIEYKEGKDFSHVPGSDILQRLPGSEIPVLPAEAIHPSPEKAILFPAPDANAVRGGEDGKYMLFSAGNFFALHQIEVDYKAVDGTVFPVNPKLNPGQLPRVKTLLREGKNLRITLIGDSISEGLNSTKQMNCPPFAPPYIETVVKGLESKYHGTVELLNAAIGGTCSKQAFEIRDRWANPPCDLFLIAYGMNDFARTSPEEFRNIIQEIMQEKRSIHPETEFLLITSMSGNPLWKSLPAGADLLFAEELKKLESETVAIADVNHFWNEVRKRKDFYDITGNGVNHPNDYGYQLYAKVLLDLFR